MSDLQLVDTGWGLMRLPLLSYRMTERENKRRKQVCHCLLNICEQAVNSVTEMRIFLNLHNFLCLCGKPLSPFNWAASPLPKLSLSHHLLTSRNRPISFSLCANSPSLFEQPYLSLKPTLVSRRLLAQKALSPDLLHKGLRKLAGRSYRLLFPAKLRQIRLHNQVWGSKTYPLWQLLQCLFNSWKAWT